MDEILYSCRQEARKDIIQNKRLPYVCSECGLSEWRGKQLSLHLHHLDGNKENHTLSNFSFLCPNCHSLTETYGGRNARKPKNQCIDCGSIIHQRSTRCLSCSNKINIQRRYSLSP